MPQLKINTIIIAFVIAMVISVGTAFAADDTDRLYNIEDASGMFNERGYLKSNSFSLSGNEVINDFNGNLMYTQRLFYMPLSENGLHFDMKIAYNGNVSHTAFGARKGMNAVDQTPINLPEWIISVNDIAVQTFNFENELISWQTGVDTVAQDDDVAALIEGYHKCYRESQAGGIHGVVSILAGDGSVREFYSISSTKDGYAQMVSGEYISCSKDDTDRGYLWPNGTTLYGHFTLFRSDGTKVLFKIIQPDYRRDVDCAVNIPKANVNYPRVLLPVLFNDQMGHEIPVSYEMYCDSNFVPECGGSHRKINGRPLLKTVAEVTLSWMFWESYLTPSNLVLVSAPNFPPYNLSFANRPPDEPLIAGRPVSLFDDANRGLVYKIDHASTKVVTIAYRSYSRFYRNLKMGLNSLEYRYGPCGDEPDNKYAARAYRLEPWRISRIQLPDGGCSYYHYYADRSTAWGQGAVLGPVDTISLSYAHDVSCMDNLTQIFPCKKSGAFDDLGRDPFFLNIVVAARRTLSAAFAAISTDSLTFSWFDSGGDLTINSEDQFFTERLYGPEISGPDKTSVQNKKRELEYRYYQEKGKFSAASRDRGWAMKMIASTESDRYNPSDSIRKDYFWNTSFYPNTCCGTLLLDSLRTAHGAESYVEKYSYYWDGDPSLDETNILTSKIVRDPWNIRLVTEYDITYTSLGDPEIAHFECGLIRDFHKSLSSGQVLYSKHCWYYNGLSEDGYKGQLMRSTEYTSIPGTPYDSSANTFTYIMNETPQLKYRGAIKEHIDPQNHVTHYSYPGELEEITYKLQAHDGTTLVVPRTISFEDAGPSYFKLSRYINSRWQNWYRKTDNRGQLEWVVDPNGYRSDIVWDGFGRVFKTILPGGYRPGSKDDPETLPPGPQDTAWSTWYNYYDDPVHDTVRIEHFVRVSKTRPSMHDKLLIDGQSRAYEHRVKTSDGGFDKTFTQYDHADRPIETMDEAGISTWCEYDYLDRLKKTEYTAPGFPSNQMAYSVTNAQAVGLTSKFAFPETIIFKQVRTDENGHIVNEYYDVRGKLRLKQTYDGQTPLSTYFDYDDVGNLTLVIRPNGDSLKYKYDSFGRLLEESAADYNSSFGFGTYGKITYKYDRNGNLIEKEDPSGRFADYPQKTYYEYDQLDRLTAVGDDFNFYGGHITVPVSRYFYDQSNSELSIGRLSLVFKCDLFGHCHYAERYDYDPRGRVKKQVNFFNARLDSTAQGNSWLYKAVGDSVTLLYGYDWADHLTSITYPDGSIVKYDYDVKGNLVAVGGAAAGERDKYASLTFTPRNQIESMRLGGGIQQMDYLYNERGWLESINEGISRETAPDDLFGQSLYYYEHPGHYSQLDPQFNGNLLGQRISIQGVEFDYGYGYDESDRLRQAFINEFPHETFTYDANGNFTQTTQAIGPDGLTRDFTYCTGTNKLQYVRNSGTEPDDTLTYTPIGDIERSSAKRATFGYNCGTELALVIVRNRLGSDTLRYAYNSAGERIYKAYTFLFRANCDPTKGGGDTASTLCTYSATNRTYYVLGQGGIVLAELSSVAPITYKSKFIYAGSQRIAMRDQSNNIHYFLNDHLGSTRVVVDSAGFIKDRHFYFAFGDIQGEQTSTNQSYKFTGKPLDKEAGLNLYYHGARYYDPELGRFLAVDPAAGKYPSLSPYAYCANNPLRLVDPNGATFLDGVVGAVVSIIDDRSAGALDLRDWYEPTDPSDYDLGQDIGDGLCFVGGGVEALSGVVSLVGEGAAIVGSGGTAAVAAAPAVAGSAALVTDGSATAITALKNVYSRDGRLGGAPHRGKVAEKAAELKGEGHSIEAGGGGSEKRVATKGGKKDYRYPDIISKDPNGQTQYHNVGKVNKKGAPPQRESDAIKDLEKTGKKVTYTPYN